MASRLIALLIFLTSVSCQLSLRDHNVFSSPSTSINHSKTMTTMLSTDSTQGLPADLIGVLPLWEVEYTNTPNRAGSITRLYENGQIYTWSNTRRILQDNRPSRVDAPYAWRLDAHVKEEGIDRVRELIRSEFTQLNVNNVSSLGADQGITIRRAYLDGVEHQVVLPSSATSNLPEVIQNIDYAIQSNIVPGGVPIAQ